MKNRSEYIDLHTGYLKWGCLILVIFMTGCDLLDNDNKGQCVINCEDFQFMRIDKEPAWSPDGETIAFVRGSTDPGVHGIYFINADGENLRHIYTGNAGAPSWSPDGKWIAFHKGAQIYKMHVEKDSVVQLTLEGRNFNPSWSDEENWIVYRRSLSGEPNHIQGIWIVDAKGQSNKQIFSGNSGFPTWYKTNEISFFRGVINSKGEVLGDSLWTSGIEEQNNRRLAFIGGDNRYPRFSKNNEFLFTSQHSGGYPQIWMMNLSSLEKKQLTENGGWAADWSPDGEWIVYTETYETGRLWLMRPDGSEKQQLTVE